MGFDDKRGYFKLEQFREYASALKEYQQHDIEETKNNRTLREAVERYM